MWKNWKFSIVIAAYNVSKFVLGAVDSVLAQTYKNIEVIIVNDGSTDDTLSKLNNYQNDTRVYVYSKENGGLSSARNFGIDRATGDFIMFMDADDYMDKDLVEECYSEFLSTGASMVFFGYDSVNSKGQKLVRGISMEYRHQLRSHSQVLHLLATNQLNNYSWSFISAKSLLQKATKPIFPENMYFEDIASTYKIIGKASKVAFIRPVLFHYVQRPGSITKSPSVKQARDLQQIKENISDELVDVLSHVDLKTWMFFIDLARYQILAYHVLEHRKELKTLRMTILRNTPGQVNRIAKIKTFFLKIRVYQFLYPMLARLRWL